METTIELTAEEVRAIMDYDPLTGIVRWKVRRGSTAPAGGIVGSLSNKGYLTVRINYKLYLLHRIIWLLVTGQWPVNQIDHRNLMTADNKWTNLREATCPQNHGNKRKPSNNTSGFKGVSWCVSKGKYEAYICGSGHKKHLGRYDRPEDAHAAYCEAARERFGEFFHSGA